MHSLPPVVTSPKESALYDTLLSVMRDVEPETPVVPYMLPGFTDAHVPAARARARPPQNLWRNLGRPEKAEFLCLAGSYHGETVGATLDVLSDVLVRFLGLE